MFIEVYNSITTQKHKTRDRLIKAIKETITSEDNKKELSKLYSEVQTLQKRLSNLIDLKLDKIENKDVYNEKEEEISNKIKMLNEQIELLEYKDISKRLKDIEKIINEEEQPMEMFDDVKFENLVEKIIIGKQYRDGYINPNTIRFVLKIGTEYKFKDLSFVPNKKYRCSREF